MPGRDLQLPAVVHGDQTQPVVPVPAREQHAVRRDRREAPRPRVGGGGERRRDPAVVPAAVAHDGVRGGPSAVGAAGRGSRVVADAPDAPDAPATRDEISPGRERHRVRAVVPAAAAAAAAAAARSGGSRRRSNKFVHADGPVRGHRHHARGS